MERLVIIPIGSVCSLKDCPPGLFLFNDVVGFKSRYRSSEETIESYYVDNGEIFLKNPILQVIPLQADWENVD